MSDYANHADTVYWLMREKEYSLKNALNTVAKKHSLVKTRLEKEVRQILPADFLENRRRVAQIDWVPPLLIDECKPKTI